MPDPDDLPGLERRLVVGDRSVVFEATTACDEPLAHPVELEARISGGAWQQDPQAGLRDRGKADDERIEPGTVLERNEHRRSDRSEIGSAGARVDPQVTALVHGDHVLAPGWGSRRRPIR